MKRYPSTSSRKRSCKRGPMLVMEKSDHGEYGYCQVCTADCQRFFSDRILRHYQSHQFYRLALKQGPCALERMTVSRQGGSVT